MVTGGGAMLAATSNILPCMAEARKPVTVVTITNVRLIKS